MRTNRSINFAEMSSDLARLKSASCAERFFLSVSVCAIRCSSCSRCLQSEVGLARLGGRSCKGDSEVKQMIQMFFNKNIRVGKTVVECLRIYVFFLVEGCTVAVTFGNAHSEVLSWQESVQNFSAWHNAAHRLLDNLQAAVQIGHAETDTFGRWVKIANPTLKMLESKCAGSKDTRDGNFVVIRILQHFTLCPFFAFFPVFSCQISKAMQVHLNMRSCSSCFYSAVPLTKPMPRQDDDTASETTQAVMHNAGPGASSRSGHKDSAKLLC